MRILSSQRMELDLMACQVDIGADEAVAPQGAQWERLPQHRRRTGCAGHAHEDHGSFQGLLQVGSPVLREGSPCGCVLDAHRVSGVMGWDELA